MLYHDMGAEGALPTDQEISEIREIQGVPENSLHFLIMLSF